MWGTDKWNASLADALCQTGWPWIGLNNVQRITLLCLVSLTVAGRILGWVKITSVTGKRAYRKRQIAAKRFLVVSSLEKRQCVKGSFIFLEVLYQEKPPGDTHCPIASGYHVCTIYKTGGRGWLARGPQKSREILMSWRGGLTRTSRRSARTSAESCMLLGNNPRHRDVLGATWSWWTPSRTGVSNADPCFLEG